MDHKEFISQLDEQRILDAIRGAEKMTSGEIRVYISHKERHDALTFAQRRFRELGMMKTRERNAVLIYIVPRTQQFAIVGNTGIHQKCGNDFWRKIASGMSQRMKENRFTDAIVSAIEEAGAAMQSHFPRQANDRNELPDDIAGD